MKTVLLTCALLMSLPSYALTTDYSCNLKGTNLNANALISRAGIASNDNFLLIVSNNFGYELEVFLQDRVTDKELIYKIQKLNAVDSKQNPKTISILSDDNSLEINCERADNIEYPNSF